MSAKSYIQDAQFLANQLYAIHGIPVAETIGAMSGGTLPTRLMGNAFNNQDYAPLAAHFRPNDSLEPIYDPRRGIVGSVKEGVLGAFGGHQGYAKYDQSAETIQDKQASKERRQQFSKSFYSHSPKEDWGYTIPEQVGYRVGAIVGDVIGNGTRSKMWNASPPDITSTLGGQSINEAAHGLGAPDLTISDAGRVNYKKGTRENAVLTALGTFMAVEALGQLSGNYNPLNIAEGMRPEGMSAINPDLEDPRKSTNAPVDMLERFLGRKGRVLPWEEFHQERPEIAYDHYTAYKKWQQGKDETDLLGKATLGLAKFNGQGLNNNQPELQVLGYNMTPIAIAGAVSVLGGARMANSYLGARTLKEYEDLMAVAKKRDWTPDETTKIRRNVHYQSSNEDGYIPPSGTLRNP